jgi:type II secretory pathway pseudopilin PulG
MIETMVVVSMIGLMTAAIAPALGEMMTDGRQSGAAADVVGLARRARDAAREYGFAHRLDYSAAGSNGLGSIGVSVAMTGSCLRAGGWAPSLGAIRMVEYSPALSLGRTRLILGAWYSTGGSPPANPTQVTSLSLCYEPDGETYARPPTETQFVRQPGSSVFRIERQIGGVIATTANLIYRREILFPPGGTARLR